MCPVSMRPQEASTSSKTSFDGRPSASSTTTIALFPAPLSPLESRPRINGRFSCGASLARDKDQSTTRNRCDAPCLPFSNNSETPKRSKFDLIGKHKRCRFLKGAPEYLQHVPCVRTVRSSRELFRTSCFLSLTFPIRMNCCFFLLDTARAAIFRRYVRALHEG